MTVVSTKELKKMFFNQSEKFHKFETEKNNLQTNNEYIITFVSNDEMLRKKIN